MHPKDAARIANTVDPDQTAPLGLHCLPRPGSALFAQTWVCTVCPDLGLHCLPRPGSALFAQTWVCTVCPDPDLSENLGSIMVMCPKDADRMANSVDPDQTAPLLFAQACLSKN